MGYKGIAPRILTFSSNWSWVVNFSSRTSLDFDFFACNGKIQKCALSYFEEQNSESRGAWLRLLKFAKKYTLMITRSMRRNFNKSTQLNLRSLESCMSNCFVCLSSGWRGNMGFAPLGLLLLVAASLATPPTCRVSEFFCDTGQCVALDRFCDGEDDCGDKSDEPRYCSREWNEHTFYDTCYRLSLSVSHVRTMAVQRHSIDYLWRRLCLRKYL